MTTKNKCAKCGACTVVCPVYQASKMESLTARGKLHLISHLDPSRASKLYAEILSKCLLCGACSAVCSRNLDPPSLFVAARHQLNRKAGEHRFLRSITQNTVANPEVIRRISGISRMLIDALPQESGLRLRLGLSPGTIVPTQELKPTKKQAKTANNSIINYFAGCYAKHLNLDIAKATKILVKKTGNSEPATPASQCCCGLPAYSSGDQSTARELAKNLLRLLLQSSYELS